MKPITNGDIADFFSWLSMQAISKKRWTMLLSIALDSPQEIERLERFNKICDIVSGKCGEIADEYRCLGSDVDV